ncbi:hypothetical protein [Streptomyces sp. NBC_01264]|uniref:hypothetical protein n=1 Tax=Streptomyces sp. NBC_01264 TaxID=2903804 RepID=UPI0022526FEE|nr:hypothetical protein [Streptomyces sp. NBC_01264]MCX4784636.1 hypothetical protein [Streptomyces sp. NBC_01264]
MDVGALGGGQRRPETTTDVALKLPLPPGKPVADTPVLITEEQEVFARCEVAVENLKVAFWAAGKALHIIRDGRLYRADYGSFDDYVDARWGMSRGQADKLIRMWPVAQALFESLGGDSNDPTRIRVSRLHQSSVWELLPVAEKHDPNTAVQVYAATSDVQDNPTAAVLKRAVTRVMRVLKAGEPAKADTIGTAVLEALAEEEPKKPKAAPKAPPKPPALPWDSPTTLDRMLRQHMTDENRKTLAKLLAE